MKIGDWDGGPGQRILLPVKPDTTERERRIQARKLLIALREAGIDCEVHDGKVRKHQAALVSGALEKSGLRVHHGARDGRAAGASR